MMVVKAGDTHICNNNSNVVIGVAVLLPLTSEGEHFTLQYCTFQPSRVNLNTGVILYS